MPAFATGLAELVLVVEDVPAAARFYREVVGLEPETEANDAWAWFWAGEPGVPQRVALHRGTLLFEEHSPYPPGERWGRVHFALLTPRDRLDAAVEHVRSHGVDVHGPVDFDWMQARAYYFYDLDGNLLELWSPNARAPRPGSARAASPHPIGGPSAGYTRATCRRGSPMR